MAEQAPLSGTVQVDGLAAVVGAFQRINKELAAELRGELRKIADRAAEYAIYIAQEKGLHRSGDLIAEIKGGSRGNYAYITDTAKRSSASYPAGFNYPAIYEYGGSQARRVRGDDFQIRNRTTTGVRLIAAHGLGSGHVGPRAFLEPAAQQGAARIEDEVGNLLDRLVSAAGLGNGGTL